MRLHHVQVSGPAGCEDAMRAFYVGVLGMTEVDKPERLRARGGAWFRAGSAEVHVGIEEGFAPARKAHPGLAVATTVASTGSPTRSRPRVRPSRGTTPSPVCGASTRVTPSATASSSSRRQRVTPAHG